jgi:hypothetical protein
MLHVEHFYYIFIFHLNSIKLKVLIFEIYNYNYKLFIFKKNCLYLRIRMDVWKFKMSVLSFHSQNNIIEIKFVIFILKY